MALRLERSLLIYLIYISYKGEDIMRSPTKRNFIAILTLLFVLTIGVGGSVFAQGKGHGGGKGNGGGGGQAQKGGQPPNAGRQGPPAQFQRPQPQYQRPQPQANPARQMGRGQERGKARIEQRPQPQGNPGWQMGRGQERGKIRVEQARPQPPQWRIEQPRAKQDRRPEFRNVPQPQYDPWQGRDKGRGAKQARNNQRGYQAPGLLGPPIKKDGWPNNYGYDRSTEVHIRNADRKALKDQEKMMRAYSGRTYSGGYYYQPNIVDVRRTDGWRDNILRTVVSNVITTNTPGYYLPQYTTTYYTPSYYPSAYDNGAYYGSYQSYPYNYGTVTYYNFYEPYDYSYSPYSYENSYSSDYYAGDSGLPYLSGSSSIGGFVGRLFSQLITFGYNQGYRDAQYARTQGRRVRFYEDPYDPYVYTPQDITFEDVGYDPYSCSGENRRYLSEGYQLGYRDALYGTTQYDPYADGGNLDLISALIGSSLSL